jgi:mono/diheme cytochrome c family protein
VCGSGGFPLLYEEEMRALKKPLVWTLACLACAGTALAAQRRTVWDGVYTNTEAKRGAAAYHTTCAGCHGADLGGDGSAPSLVGESFTFQWSDTTVRELFTRIRTLMPPDRPDSLAPETYRDLVAFVLQANKMPPGLRELDPAPENLELIAITPVP